MQTKKTVPAVAAGLILGVTVAAHELPATDRSKDLTPEAKAIHHEVVVSASTADVWTSLTTSKGLKAFNGVDSKVELSIGGAYEWYFAPDEPKFAGNRGSEGCTVLSYVPERVLSFTWNAPPYFPKLRNERTWVVVELEAKSPTSTRVTLTHLGWGEGGRWDELRDYFDKAWGNVLKALQTHHRKK